MPAFTTVSLTLPRQVEWRAPVCIAPDGVRCDGPLPIEALHLDPAGTRLYGVFICGGWLTLTEDGNHVTVTYLAPVVFPGARQCAAPTLGVNLDRPLGRRQVLDATTHRAIEIVRSRG